MNAAGLPDETVVYAEGFGETTAGEVRGFAKVEPDMLELSAQMWSDIMNEDIRWQRDPRGVSLAESRELIASAYMRGWAARVSTSNGGTETASGCKGHSPTTRVSRYRTPRKGAILL